MKDLSVKALVEGPNTGDPANFYYREEHEWRHLESVGSKMLEDFMASSLALAKTLHGHKEDGANLTCTLSATMDGTAMPDVVITGVTYTAMNKFQKNAAQFAMKLVQAGEDAAKHYRANKPHP